MSGQIGVTSVGGGGPSGAAGGDLAGTYPNPDIGTGVIVNTDVNASAAIAVSKLAAGTAGQVIQGTTPSYAYPPAYEFDYAQNATDATTAQTVQASAISLVTGATVTYDGSTAVMIEFGALIGNSNTTTTFVRLWEDSTDLVRLTQVSTNTANPTTLPTTVSLRRTPTAGAHSYTVKFYVSAGTATAYGSTTGPSFMRVIKV